MYCKGFQNCMVVKSCRTPCTHDYIVSLMQLQHDSSATAGVLLELPHPLSNDCNSSTLTATVLRTLSSRYYSTTLEVLALTLRL